jgi:hypothetical protein
MAKPARIAGLDITEDDAFERRFSRVQRAGWVVMAAVAAAALAGAFGRGPLSRATVAAEGAHVAYERVVHVHAPTRLTLELAPRAQARGEVRVALDRRYVEAMGLRRVVPEPARVEAGAQALAFVFVATDLRATFEFEPEGAGILRTPLDVQGRPVAGLVQLVLP